MNKVFANFFVFTTGAVIMAIELTASRMLAPFFGSSIFIWGNVIGVVMIALAVGYGWGGRLADRHPSLDALAGLVFICAVFLSLLPLFFKPLANFIIGFLDYPTLFLFTLASSWVVLIILALPL